MRSMTGYGQAHWQRAGRSVSVEVRGVNQRFLEVKLNMPREYFPWEAELRALVQEQVARGKVDVSIFRGGANGGQVTVEANVALAKEYVAAWRKLQHALQSARRRRPRIAAGPQRPGAGRRAPRRRRRRDRCPCAPRCGARCSVQPRPRTRGPRADARHDSARAPAAAAPRQASRAGSTQLVPQLAARLRQRVATLLEGKDIKEERLAAGGRPARRAQRRHRGAGAPREPPRPRSPSSCAAATRSARSSTSCCRRSTAR